MAGGSISQGRVNSEFPVVKVTHSPRLKLS